MLRGRGIAGYLRLLELGLEVRWRDELDDAFLWRRKEDVEILDLRLPAKRAELVTKPFGVRTVVWRANMVRARREALHHAAHAGRIGNGAEARLPIALDAGRFGGEATEWLGAGGARTQRQGADSQEDGDGDTHRCDLVGRGEWSAEDGDMTTPGERHMHTRGAQRRGRLGSNRAVTNLKGRSTCKQRQSFGGRSRLR